MKLLLKTNEVFNNFKIGDLEFSFDDIKWNNICYTPIVYKDNVIGVTFKSNKKFITCELWEEYYTKLGLHTVFTNNFKAQCKVENNEILDVMCINLVDNQLEM